MKMEKTYFKEEQYFSNFWFWVFLIVAFTASLAPTCVAIYSELVLKNPSGENPESAVSLMVILIILVVVYSLVILLFKRMKLVIRITNKGLLFKYPPFILKDKTVLKEEIEKYKIRKYKPLREYSVYGRAYIVKGNIGLQLYLVGGKKILFGTQRGDAMLRAMDKMTKENEGE
ncbi:MAG: hypothetical protein V2I62_03050 [Bacteroidales bacterium]|jgi:hypothetical protein|nr:hypothetical protein [Bacteroidales bacterium]